MNNPLLQTLLKLFSRMHEILFHFTNKQIFICRQYLIPGKIKAWLKNQDITHTRCGLYYPMTQGKIECYHRSMKYVTKLQHYYFLWELENAIDEWIQHYNYAPSHESLDNVMPADVHERKTNDILDERAIIISRTQMQYNNKKTETSRIKLEKQLTEKCLLENRSSGSVWADDVQTLEPSLR